MAADANSDQPQTESLGRDESRRPSVSPGVTPGITPLMSPGTTAQVPASRSAPLPASFGPYVILGELARGGMGVVYHVRDSRLGREVALKMVRSAELALPVELERFQREARAVAKLQHPHIVPLYDVGTIDGQPYFTMELARGGSLAESRGRFQADRHAAVALLARVARALDHLHSQGLLHRDLKPGNILLRENDEPLISDFGLAKSVGTETDLTRTGAAVGTLSYMAPEQASIQPHRYGPATDIWSLGIIAYELVCGSRPFAARSTRSLTDAILTDPPPPPRQVRPDLDRDLETILLKCLEKEPGQRYASAGALADDLEAWLAGAPIKARPIGRLRRLARQGRRHWRIVAVVLLVAVLAVPWIVQRVQPDPDAPLKRIEAELARQQPVTLLGETGVPAWSQPLSAVEVLSGPDDVFKARAGFVGMILLVPHVKVKQYRVEAQLRLDSDPQGTAGLFVCHAQHDLRDGPLREFAIAGLSIDPPQAPDETTPLFALVHSVPKSRAHQWRQTGIDSAERLPRPADGWHRLAVRISPESLQVTLDGKAVAALSQDQRLKHAAIMLQDRLDSLGAVHPVFPPHGGVGLYLSEATVSYRNVTVTPEPPDQP
jgi:tRNA A-37 threonylcarbamoyl transferase component Bud32